MAESLRGALVTLRPTGPGDLPDLVRIRATPEVASRWGTASDMAARVADEISDPGTETLVIEYEGRVVGVIQWWEQTEPMYRHAGIDIYLDPAVHGRGLGTDAVRTLAR
ncbi:MAG: GNAT family N-acetyltransferase, partial [Actinomycetes bacterium]